MTASTGEMIERYGVIYVDADDTGIMATSTGEMIKRYGVIYVDADDTGNGSFDRYKKDSFYWCQRRIASNGENLD